MGRYVYENGNCVWKYVFAEQPSEQGRIFTEFNIGDLFLRISEGCQNDGDCETCPSEDDCCPTHEVPYYAPDHKDGYKDDVVGDTLQLKYSDIPALRKIIEDAGDNYIKAKDLYDKTWGDKDSMLFSDCEALAMKTSELCGENFNFYQMIEVYIKYMEEEYKDCGLEEFFFDGEW